MNPYYPHLFEPLTIKRTTFKNRLFVAPHMMSHMDFNGRPDESMIDFYAEKAKGGYAVVTLGDTPVDREHAGTNPRSFACTPEKPAQAGRDRPCHPRRRCPGQPRVEPRRHGRLRRRQPRRRFRGLGGLGPRRGTQGREGRAPRRAL